MMKQMLAYVCLFNQANIRKSKDTQVTIQLSNYRKEKERKNKWLTVVTKVLVV